ncbi:hypothetical protein [Subtercola boreus]|uniref:hypothetical protein n=1 Tax=Subtercola boreus TaxID=120213 RepID=UPI0011534761|nr:hypothetical protein [Subtercola boreus]TQL46888.1 hypothetical protein FB464_3882 [Subtercola boreus]
MKQRTSRRPLRVLLASFFVVFAAIALVVLHTSAAEPVASSVSVDIGHVDQAAGSQASAQDLVTGVADGLLECLSVEMFCMAVVVLFASLAAAAARTFRLLREPRTDTLVLQDGVEYPVNTPAMTGVLRR